MKENIGLDRRGYLKLAGIAATAALSKESMKVAGAEDTDSGYGVSGYGEGGYGGNTEESSLSVKTLSATDVDASSALLGGEVTDLGSADLVTALFEYRLAGDSQWSETASTTLSTASTYSVAVSGLESDSSYEFRSVVYSERETFTGETQTFTTESNESPEPVLSIDQFELTDRSNPRWARVRADWSVSVDGGELDTVLTKLIAENVEDCEMSSVEGSEASGKHGLRKLDGDGSTYDVQLVVLLKDNHYESTTKRITLG